MISMAITEIGAGWADVEFVFGGQSILAFFEHCPNDAFEDLIYSALRITYGNDAEVVFPNGPDRIYLLVEKIDETVCRLTLGECSEEIPVKEYVRAVLRMFDRYVFAHSAEEYAKEWRFPFPSANLEKLREKYRAL